MAKKAANKTKQCLKKEGALLIIYPDGKTGVRASMSAARQRRPSSPDFTSQLADATLSPDVTHRPSRNPHDYFFFLKEREIIVLLYPYKAFTRHAFMFFFRCRLPRDLEGRGLCCEVGDKSWDSLCSFWLARAVPLNPARLLQKECVTL